MPLTKKWEDAIAEAGDSEEAKALAEIDGDSFEQTPAMKPTRQVRHTRTARLGTEKDTPTVRKPREQTVVSTEPGKKEPKGAGVRHLHTKAAVNGAAIEAAEEVIGHGAAIRAVDPKRGSRAVRTRDARPRSVL